MISNDFDSGIQEIFNSKFSEIQITDWRKWLKISSKEEYFELILKNSGLASIEDISERIKQEKSNSKDLSIDFDNYINNFNKIEPLILCHSSGTTNSSLNALKWFHMSNKTVQRYWAPGMQAIFESSGLSSDSSVVIFVPSRLKIDGLNTYKQSKYISLYSSEFSQRLMLSIIQPQSYTFFEYKNSKNLNIIAKILSLNNVSTISAPAATVLGWADINKLKTGLKKSLKGVEENPDEGVDMLLNVVKSKGIERGALEIQKKLSNKLSKATLVFSISSLLEKDWGLIRTFMNWQLGEEKFTNLYVASEIGPFAGSIDKNVEKSNSTGAMNVFPLTLPVIESKGNKQFISETSSRIGNLLISRMNLSKAYINLDVGDVINIIDQQSLPLIEGQILRSSFQLKYPIKISKEITLPNGYTVYAGDYFTFNKFDIYDPRSLLNCLKSSFKMDCDAFILIGGEKIGNNHWKLVLFAKDALDIPNLQDYKNALLNCVEDESLKEVISNDIIEVQLINESPVDFLATRAEILDKVRTGKVPKGILKKWPLYVINV
ncbi:MAG: hypothetical protein ACFFEO_16875 [Candidatus Thorarchaeota archaeon]